MVVVVVANCWAVRNHVLLRIVGGNANLDTQVCRRLNDLEVILASTHRLLVLYDNISELYLTSCYKLYLENQFLGVII